MEENKIVPVYWEFDPRDFKNCPLSAIAIMRHYTWAMYGAYPNAWKVEIGKLPNNAELHYYKSEITIPASVKTHWE